LHKPSSKRPKKSKAVRASGEVSWLVGTPHAQSVFIAPVE
jgi:hypothetical protein